MKAAFLASALALAIISAGNLMAGELPPQGPGGRGEGRPQFRGDEAGDAGATQAAIRENMGKRRELRKQLFALAKERATATDERKAAIDEDVRKIVTEAFDLTTKQRELINSEERRRLEAAKARLEAATEKLSKFEKSLEQRKAKRDSYISDFIARVASGEFAKDADKKDAASEPSPREGAGLGKGRRADKGSDKGADESK